MVHDHRQLWRDLKRENAILRAQLQAADITPVSVGVRLPELTDQECLILGVLLRAHPRAVDRYALDAEVPTVSAYGERDIGHMSVKVCHIRKALGEDAIETIRGVGYRLGDATAAMLRGGASAANGAGTHRGAPRQPA